MSGNVKVVCPVCRKEFEVSYVLLGAPISCPGCGETIVPVVPVGAVYPRTEYEMTFSDFRQLVTARAYRSAVAQLVADWFDYELKDYGESTIVKSRDGETLGLLEVHRNIQEDSARQRELYRTAMALWR